MYIIFGEYGSLKQEWENKNKNRNERGRKRRHYTGSNIIKGYRMTKLVLVQKLSR